MSKDNDREAWEAALYQEERKREKMRCGKIEDHIRKLAEQIAWDSSISIIEVKELVGIQCSDIENS